MCAGHVVLGLAFALTWSLTGVRGARFHSCKIAVSYDKTLTDADGKQNTFRTAIIQPFPRQT